jgi:hypothetical protein
MDIKIDPREEFESIDFGDKRLNKRLLDTVEQMAKKPQESVLGSGEGRTEAKGFYRLLANPKFSLDKLRECETNATAARMGMFDTVLLIQDTTDVNMHTHAKTEGLGYCSEHIRGVKIHSCIALTPEGFPLGLLGQDYETRENAKDETSKDERKKRPIEEKESFRWIKMLRESSAKVPDRTTAITITDREGDMYELYAETAKLDEKFIIRVVHNRKTENGDKLMDAARKAIPIGKFSVLIPRDTRRNIPQHLIETEVAYCEADVLKPLKRKEGHLPESVNITIVRITEITERAEPIEWILATNLPVSTAEECMEVVGYYVQRWKIERFHFVLKSGCNIEKIQQRTYVRLLPLFFINSVIAIYIMSVTFVGRIAPDTSCEMFFDDIEWKLLFCLGKKP